MSNYRCTVDQVMSWRPCDRYDRKRITSLFRGRETLGLEEIKALPIPSYDRLWAACQLVTQVSLKTARLFAAHLATEELLRRQERDTKKRIDVEAWNVVALIIMHARGEATDEQLADAQRKTASEVAYWATEEEGKGSVCVAYCLASRVALWSASCLNEIGQEKERVLNTLIEMVEVV